MNAKQIKNNPFYDDAIKLFDNKAIDWDTIAHYMDNDIREQLHNYMAPCTKMNFLLSYLDAHYRAFGSDFIIN